MNDEIMKMKDEIKHLEKLVSIYENNIHGMSDHDHESVEMFERKIHKLRKEIWKIEDDSEVLICCSTGKELSRKEWRQLGYSC